MRRGDCKDIDVYADREHTQERARICDEAVEEEFILHEPPVKEFLKELRNTYGD